MKEEKNKIKNCQKELCKPMFHFISNCKTEDIQTFDDKSIRSKKGTSFNKNISSKDAKNMLQKVDFNVYSEYQPKISYINYIQNKIIDIYKEKIKEIKQDKYIEHDNLPKDPLEFQRKICEELKNFSQYELLLISGFLEKLDSDAVVKMKSSCRINLGLLGGVKLKVLSEKIEKIKRERRTNNKDNIENKKKDNKNSNQKCLNRFIVSKVG